LTATWAYGKETDLNKNFNNQNMHNAIISLPARAELLLETGNRRASFHCTNIQFWGEVCDVKTTIFSEINDNTDNQKISTVLKKRVLKISTKHNHKVTKLITYMGKATIN
jgi:hypothetical protein